MRDCHEWEAMIDRAGDPAFTDEEARALVEHLETCEACAGLYDLVGRMRTDELVPEPDELDLRVMRRAVMRAIQRDRATSRWPRLASLFDLATAHPALRLATLGLLLAAAVLAGRVSVTGPRATPTLVRDAAPAPNGALASEIHRAAATSRRLEDVENSPYTYSNVQIRDAADDRVAVGFDVSRHLELELRRDDPLLTEVLVQALIEPSAVGTRLKAIGYAGDLLDPRVRDGLIRAMLDDPELIVRMKAQARLVEKSDDDTVERALLDVLAREESVQMRLVAIDYLTRSRVPPSALEQAITAGPDGRAAVFVRARGYLTHE